MSRICTWRNIDTQSGRYVYRGQLEQARSESDWIAVKGQRPVEFRQWVTRHGPVNVSDDKQLLRSALGRGRAGIVSVSISRARTAPAIGRVHGGACAVLRVPDKISSTPMSTGTSAIMPRAYFPSGATTTVTCRWMAVRAITSGTASSRSTSFRRSTIRREAGSSRPTRIRFRKTIPTACTAISRRPIAPSKSAALLTAHERLEARTTCSACQERRVFGFLAVSGAANSGGLTIAKKPDDADLRDAVEILRPLERTDGEANAGADADRRCSISN